ncbi:MAG: molybdopterin-binding protein [Anaerolineae bacterium]|uniref:molybdopterin-binding protein n=1 Tax=Thermoflexus sp. TaxID=1969742 RepID=UPI0025E78A45|nr:molybdopterin-binding protein [Thermoflexus sp.]MCS7352262.1 molybdopterin-binding protein [Thermoflexus sp.]MDW8181724.1 molybdopterin-binding protein [Anaerolineae bacterium]
MKFGPVPVEAAVGCILAHNLADAQGNRLFRKGRRLTSEDVARLRAEGYEEVVVAELEPGDVGEDEAARRIARACEGPHLRPMPAAGGRVNFLADAAGVFLVEIHSLEQLNRLPGVTLATLARGSVVRPRQIVASLKIIPFALPEAVVARAEALLQGNGPLMGVYPFQPHRVVLILSGHPAVWPRLMADFEGPLQERVEACGGVWLGARPVRYEERELARAMEAALQEGADFLILAGETAIMDEEDTAPRAIRRIGGTIEAFGAPVDPGNLLLIAYYGGIPILGAPGCARSRHPNVVDWVIPRLMAGLRLTREEIAAMGHGGLLEDVEERPTPRQKEFA